MLNYGIPQKLKSLWIGNLHGKTERSSLVWNTLYKQFLIMRLNDVLDNRQSETGTALLPRPGFIDPEKNVRLPLVCLQRQYPNRCRSRKLAPEHDWACMA